MHIRFCHKLTFFYVVFFAVPFLVSAQVLVDTATTTLNLSICGDSVVNPGEECDVPGETGTYSTTIAGRQCSAVCQFGPYCGDNILQTVHGEECDDGNNVSNDFCSATCQIENPGSGGGSSQGSGGGGSGGSNDELGDTAVTIEGRAYPNRTVNIIQDGSAVGTVRADSDGDFLYSQDVDPGTTSFGFWAEDSSGIRSITFNTTFDVTQGAVTNLTGILLPPTISIDNNTVDFGDSVTFSGQSPSDVDIELQIDNGAVTESVGSESNGDWSILFDTSRVSQDSHTAKARFSYLDGTARIESIFSSVLTFFVGVAPGNVVTSSDLNVDGSVNLIDFSILIFWWGTAGGNSNPPADINSNGNVGLEDFSILLFNWTG